MTISFSGLATGLDTSSWVEAMVAVKKEKVTELQTKLTAKQQVKTTLNDTRSTVSTLRSSIEKFTDSKFGGSFDLFSKVSAKSSNEELFTATVNGSSPIQNYNVKVKQLATYTKATSKEAASKVADDETKLTNMGITTGELTTYVNGKKTVIKINDNDTLGDLKTKLLEAGTNVQIDEQGILALSAQNEGDVINIGATTDTTNFVSLTGIDKKEDGSYKSTNSLYKATVSTKLVGEDSGFRENITAGTFMIGSETFTIDENTTLSSLISNINNNKNAQAYAYWDDATGKLSITSTKEGASFINIEAGTSNFTDVMGLTETERSESGEVISSKMLTETQELGKNAIFSINGTEMVSTSNTITSDISRIEGLTLTLKRASKEDEEAATLEVTQNTTQLKEAVNSFIKAYNGMISKIDEVTANGADLHGESSLTSLKSTLRSFVNSSNTTNGGVYKLLSDIGIKTATADGSTLSSDITSLSLDEDKFMAAMQENPESVKAILAGENSILARMEDAVEQSLKASVGYFDVKTSTLDSDISNFETKIKKQTESVNTYKTQLESKFYKMEQAISQMQQNYSSFLTS